MSYKAYMTEDHEAIRALARDFAEKTLAPIAAEIDRTDHFPDEVKQQMADLGFFGLKIPEEYGGLGLDMRSYVSVMEEIGAKSAAAGVLITQANSLSTQPLIQVGTEEQKQAYLPGVVAGDGFIAFGLTEPGAGSDAGSVLTKAVKDGDDYILNGRKCFITGAPIAKYTVVYAKTDPEKGTKGMSCFMVPSRSLDRQARRENGAAGDSGQRRGPGGRPGAEKLYDRSGESGLYCGNEDPLHWPDRRGRSVTGDRSGST